MRVLAISGSLRQSSYNTALLRAAAEAAPAGVELDLYEALPEVPPYDEDLDQGEAPLPVRELRERIRAADAVLIATPEYNGSIPGQLKNALDWASRPFPGNTLRGKPVAVVGASSGSFGAVWAQADLQRVLGLIGARTVEPRIAVPRAQEEFDADGRPRTAGLGQQLRALLAELGRGAECPAARTA